MKRKPLNKSRFTYLKQNTPLNVVPEKKLKKADLNGLIENRGKSRFRTKKLRERVDTLIRSDLVFKNKTNASVPSPLTLVRTTFVPQLRNALKAKHSFHLNIHAKRSMHLLVLPTTCEAISEKRKSGKFISQFISKADQQKETVEKDEIGNKHIVKRTVLGSTRKSSNTSFKVHSQDLKQLIEGRGRKVSPYKARLLERKKLSLIYGNLGWREIRKCVLQSKHKKGVASPKSGNKKTRPQTSSLPENLITLLESRLDVVLYRCRFFPSFSSCKQAINHGKIFVNHRQVRIAGHLLKGGDLIQVNPQSKQSLLVQSDSTATGSRAAIGSKTFVNCPGSTRLGTHKLKCQDEVVSKKANCLLALENEKQKTLLYFQNKIKSRPLSPSLPSALLTRFDPLHHFPWNRKQKPNRALHNNTSFAAKSDNKQDYGSCFLKPSWPLNYEFATFAEGTARSRNTAVPASKPLRATGWVTRTKTPPAKQLNLENQANSLFRDLKKRKRILQNLSSRCNERLHGNGERFKHKQHSLWSRSTRTTNRLVKPLRNRDNPSLFLRPQIPGLKKLFPPFYRNVKPLNLEVSYQTLTAIFLFPPQKVYFPAHIDLEMIGKSI